jgi:hypothetical protein
MDSLIRLIPYGVLSVKLSNLNRGIRIIKSVLDACYDMSLEERKQYLTYLIINARERDIILNEINRHADLYSDEKVAADLAIKGFFAEP